MPTTVSQNVLDIVTQRADPLQVQPVPDHHSLELAYEKSLRQTDVVYDEEKTRQLHLQILLLDDENDNLHDQLVLNGDRVDELERRCNGLKDSLDGAQNSLETAQSEMRLKSREIETLKVTTIEQFVVAQIANEGSD